jgi:uncharacterized membrane protein YfcA
MEGFIQSFEMSGIQWGMLLLCAALVGMSKTGLSGLGLLIVPLLSNAFGGRPSVGLLLPMLIFGDIFAVSWYNRHAQWKHVLKLIPWAVAGIIAGAMTGKQISEGTFNRLLAGIVILGIGLLIWQDLRSKKVSVPDYWWFSAVLGLLGGFATMIGNAAGPIMALYLLSMRLPKNHFIGTGAWFFFIVNVSKVPIHIFSWETITMESFMLNAMMIPAIAAGAALGIFLVRFFPEKIYRIFIILTTVLAAVLLF